MRLARSGPGKELGAEAGRIRHLDGIRGVAIGLVVLHHTGLSPFAGGGIGVIIFFVLSGFLITQLLLRRDALNENGIVAFYARRLVRLTPPLIVMVVVTSLFEVAFVRGDGLARVVRGAWPAVAYVEDFVRTRAASFGHTWSLSVEEQFYLLWPVTLVVLLRLRDRWMRRAGLCIGIVSGVVFRAVAFGTGHVSWVAYTFAGNFSGLLLGGLVALEWRGMVSWAKERSALTTDIWLGACVCWILLTGFANLTADIPDDLNQFIVSGATAALIIGLQAGLEKGQVTGVRYDGLIVGRLLSGSAIVWLGRMSYSLYLWHLPVLTELKAFAGPLTLERRLSLVPEAAVGTAVLTLISFFVVEVPCQRLAGRIGHWVRQRGGTAEAKAEDLDAAAGSKRRETIGRRERGGSHFAPRGEKDRGALPEGQALKGETGEGLSQA